jgi:excisionase family DNA binding protein
MSLVEKVDWPHVGLTVDEAAEALRVDRRTIFKAIQEGGLPARKVGKGFRISHAAIDAWLASGDVSRGVDDSDGEE